MFREIDTGIFQVAINIDGEWWIDEIIPKWFKELKLNNTTAYNSRKVYARALDIFLHYYLYFPQKKNQSLHEYLLEFREKLRTGFSISSTRNITTNRLSFSTKYKVFAISSYSVATINAYMTSIQYYLQYLNEQNLPVDSMVSQDIDWSYLKRKSLNSKGGGFGLMMGPLLAQLLGPKKKLIRNIKKDRQSSDINNYFPPELFFDLLKISDSRERAIYLLCGCAGARIGQALSLTRDDYNYDTQEVFLIDPLSDETGPSGKTPRSKLLRSEYNIDMEEIPYKYIACKYPIPTQYDELLWIDNYFKTRFFKELSATNKGNPVQNKHPFVFNTSTGKILTPNEVYNTFKRKVNKLTVLTKEEWREKRNNCNFNEKIQLDDEYEYLITQLSKVKGLHSLRHMYAILWADEAAYTKNVNINDLQSLCAYGLGHTNISSVLQYFTLRKKTREKMIKKITQNTEDHLSYIQKKISEVKNYKKGYYHGR